MRCLLRLWTRGNRSADSKTISCASESIVSDERIEGLPILVLANKSDAENGMPVGEIQTIIDGLIKKVETTSRPSEFAVMAISALKG